MSASERWVVLGVARVRAPWFSDVARWATSGQLAMDFLKTVSTDEVRSHLRSGRPFSAVLVDGGLPGVDRDLLELAADHGCTPIVVGDRARRWWSPAPAVPDGRYWRPPSPRGSPRMWSTPAPWCWPTSR